MWVKKHIWELTTVIFMAVFVAAIILWNQDIQGNLQHYNNENITYQKAEVHAVDNTNLEKDSLNSKRYTGLQRVTVKLLSGKYKGEVKEVENYLTAANHILAEEGMIIIVSQDEPAGTEPYFLVYNYYRTPYMAVIVAAFFICMVVIGGKKGVRATAGLVFTLFTVIGFLVPAITVGYSPILASVLTVVITTAVSLILLNGFSGKTMAAVLSTACGVLLVGVIFAVCSKMMHLSGYNTDEAEFMVLISKNTGLKISEVLFAGVLTASLGAVMDVGMSISSALYEISEVDKKRTAGELLKSGLNIGKDIIGTMSNTLILAFAGSGLTVLLVLNSYGIKYHQLMSSDYLALEIGKGLSATMAVILTVPITSLISSLLYKRKKR